MYTTAELNLRTKYVHRHHKLDRSFPFLIALGETSFSRKIRIHKDVKWSALAWFMYNNKQPEDRWLTSQDFKSSLINTQC
jgi:hypothetical protein